MKKAFVHRLIVAGVVLLTVPAAVFAQKEDKDKNKDKDVQIITITRKGNTDDKAVIEINGDKVKVNGKDVEGKDGDVTVRVNRFKNMEHLRPSISSGDGNFNFNFNNNDGVSLFNEDANRAMLGV